MLRGGGGMIFEIQWNDLFIYYFCAMYMEKLVGKRKYMEEIKLQFII